MTTAPTGLWYDTITRCFTLDEPSEAIQIVAPGSVVPPRYLALYGRLSVDGVMAADVAESGYHPETATEPDVETATAPASPETATEPSPGLVVVGGGWYELPNGERVRGRDEAEVALAGLRDA